VSSLAAMQPMPLKATYAASKRFLLDFSCALRQEMKTANTNILTLCPAGLVTTNKTMSAIAAQGIIGHVTTFGLEKLTKRTIDKVLSGRQLYIPGALNHVISVAGKMLPRKIIVKLLYHRWRNAQKQWLTENLSS